MEETDLMKIINIDFSPVFEFITSLSRIENNKEIKDKKTEYGLTGNTAIEKWVNSVYDSFSRRQKELLNFYFREDNSFGLGLIDYVYQLMENGNRLTVEGFIKRLKQIEKNKLIYYLLNQHYNGSEDISIDSIKNCMDSKNIYDIIENKFELITAGKWNVLKILSKPGEVKEELLELFVHYYINFYKEKEKETYRFLEKYCQTNEELITDTAIKFIQNVFTSGKERTNNNKQIKVFIIYCGEFMSITNIDNNYCILGYDYHKFVDKAFSDINSIEKQALIFKALGDKTRLKIIRELLNGPSYMTELGEKLEVSTPTINYHIKKFFNAGLVQIDKAENRIYYKLRKDKLQDVIKLMEKNYQL